MRAPPLLSLMLLAAVGCRPPDSECETPGSCVLPPDAGHEDSGTVDAGPDADGGMPSDAGPQRYRGRVAIATLERVSDLHIATAAFLKEDQASPSEGCDGTSERAGSCCFHQPLGSTPVPMPVSAGEVSFTVAGAQVAMLDPVMGGYFTYQWGPPTPPAPGDTVTVTAAGDVVSTFTVQAVQPGPFVSLMPPWSGGTMLSIDRTKDFTFTWQPGTSGLVRVLMSGQGTGAGNPNRGVIECEVADSLGAVTIPASLLSHFVAGDICNICGLNRVRQGSASTSNAEIGLELVRYGGGGASFK